MKKILIIFSLTLIRLSLIAQDWECFPSNQRSYYQFTRYNGEAIDLIVQDSTKIDSASTALYFRRYEVNPGAESCRPELFTYLEQVPYSNYAFIDSLLQVGDTIKYFRYGDTVLFLSKANPGESWSFNTYGLITITCDSIRTDSVFGQVDSVKYFHTAGAMPMHQIRLSRSYGFLDFIPFYYFLSSSGIVPYHLVGLEKNLIQQGFQPPHFFDFLPYHAGDILKWDFHVDGMLWSPSYHFTYRDSITQVLLFSDSLIYTYDRTKVDSGNNVSVLNSQTMKFTRSNFGNMLDSPPNDLGIFIYDPAYYESYIHFASTYNIFPDTILSDNWIERNFQWTNNTLRNDSSCTVVEIIDGIGSAYSFNTHQGMVYENYYGQSNNWLTTLTGAKINGVTYGDPSLSVGINSVRVVDLHLYPNPFRDRLNISINTAEFDYIELIDLYGHLIHSQKWIKGMNQINASGLPAGIYVLRLVGSNTIRSLVLKQ